MTLKETYDKVPGYIIIIVVVVLIATIATIAFAHEKPKKDKVSQSEYVQQLSEKANELQRRTGEELVKQVQLKKDLDFKEQAYNDAKEAYSGSVNFVTNADAELSVIRNKIYSTISGENFGQEEKSE